MRGSPESVFNSLSPAVFEERGPVEKSPDAFRTISEVADSLDVPQHVLRFWEGKFPQVKPLKRAGGRRYYRPEDIDLLRGIRTLLYGEGYTIKGVQKVLREAGLRHVTEIGRNGVKGVGRAGFGARLVRVEDAPPPQPTPMALPEPSHVRIVRAPVPVIELEVVEDEDLEIASGDEEDADADILGAPARLEGNESEEAEAAAFTEGEGDDEDDDDDDDEGEDVLASGDDDEDEAADDDDEEEYDEDADEQEPFTLSSTSGAEARSGAPAFGLTERQRLRLETALKELLALRDLLARYKPKAEAAE
jgi:DNA-binding transcriptional MerR regulator